MATFREPVRTTDTSKGLVAATLANTVGSDNGTAVDAIRIVGAANAADADVLTITNASLGQASTLTIPDPGASTANIVLSKGTQTLTGTYTITAATITTGTVTTLTSTTSTITTANVTDLSYGATPVHLPDAGSSTISGAAGASNVCNVSVQIKDGAGNNLTRSVPFKVYSSSAADGLTIQSAASTGYAVSAGGLKLPNENSSVTQGISCMSSATGSATLTLTDTGKATSYLVLVVGNGTKISTQLSAGSYGP